MATTEKVLVVDGDLEELEFIEKIAVKAGHVVQTLRYYGKFADAYAAFNPTMIFLDLRMPRLDGIEITQWLIKTGSTVPVFLMSEANAVVGELAALLDEANGTFPVSVLRKPLKARQTKIALNGAA